jgi:hypothetical protein
MVTVKVTIVSMASWAINLSACAALLVCTVIAALFIDAFLGPNLKWVVGAFSLLLWRR